MATLGVLARVEVERRETTLVDLDQLEGVSTFSVEEEERIGILIEGASLDAVHSLLVNQVENVQGVMGAWPVYTHLEDAES